MVQIIACNGMSQGEPQRLKNTLEEINTDLHFFLFLKVKSLCFQYSSQIFSILSLILKGEYFPVLHKLGLWYLLYLICQSQLPSFKHEMISLKNWEKCFLHLERKVLRNKIILSFLAAHFEISQRCLPYNLYPDARDSLYVTIIMQPTIVKKSV